jgi:hypothetical protein
VNLQPSDAHGIHWGMEFKLFKLTMNGLAFEIMPR